MIEETSSISVGVLIVDDNPAKLTALAAVLDGMDVEIVTATSGIEALHCLLEQDFAVVLLDVNMPVMDGFETAKMIRSRPKSEHLPIIFITAERLADDAKLQGYSLGAVDYITSPVLPQILRSKVAVFADLCRLREQSLRYNEALRESEEKFHTLYESSRDALLTSIPDAGFTDGNQAAVKLFGCRDEHELTTLTPADISPEFQPDGRKSADKVQEITRLVMKNGSHSFEWQHRRMDGSEFIAEVLLTLTEIGGKPVIQASVRDITQRKQAEDALRNSEEQYRTMIENSNDMIWTLAPDCRFTFVNQQAAVVTGRSVEDWLGKTFEPLVLEEDLSKALEIHRKVMGGQKIHYEVRGKKQDGGIMILSVNSSPIFKDGKVSGTISFASDITERKRAEAELAEQMAELRRWHKAISGREGRILTIKHEVNELLKQAGQPPRYPSAE